jgi:hypothetical protein
MKTPKKILIACCVYVGLYALNMVIKHYTGYDSDWVMGYFCGLIVMAIL